jgi:hypothetical protein
MDNGKRFDIKERLDALERLPGEAPFHKDAAWEQLHGRLQKKPRRNGAVWYWAAACLLPVILLLWISTNNKETVLVKTTLQQKKHTTLPVIQLPPSQKETATVAAALSIEKSASIKNVHTPAGHITNKNNIQIPSSLVVTNEKTPVAVPEMAASADTMAVIATVAVVKKKLRVVHINELETTPVVNPEQLASSAGHAQNRFRFVGARSVNTAPAGRQEYASGLQIPLTN